jgi:hypothetical protein
LIQKKPTEAAGNRWKPAKMRSLAPESPPPAPQDRLRVLLSLFMRFWVILCECGVLSRTPRHHTSAKLYQKIVVKRWKSLEGVHKALCRPREHSAVEQGHPRRGGGLRAIFGHSGQSRDGCGDPSHPPRHRTPTKTQPETVGNRWKASLLQLPGHGIAPPLTSRPEPAQGM